MSESEVDPLFFIKRSLKARDVMLVEVLQTLWSGYGYIARYRVVGASGEAWHVILKVIQLDKVSSHPRGWQSDHAHERKVHSYFIESAWYQHWSHQCSNDERVPKLLESWHGDRAMYLLLEDLDEAGFPVRCQRIDVAYVSSMLYWLASFHARFLVSSPKASWPEGLWPCGTYWHLGTRLNEWQAMAEGPYKRHAYVLDKVLRSASFQTIVHGDAKIANFCFSHDKQSVAAVDFQYIGRGVGVQDVAYCLGSCLPEEVLEQHSEYLLELYFSELARCLVAKGESPDYAEAVTQQWYQLFPVAWADFHRFLLGWSPDHPKNTRLSQRIAAQGLEYALAHDQN